MSKELYSAKDLSELLNISRQAVHLAEREKRIEEPKYKMKSTKAKCWTKEQVERIVKSY